MDLKVIQERLKELKMLPTFPFIVGEVLGILNDPKSSARDLAKRMDPSITGEILRIANSAYFGTKSFRTINTIEHAIAIVGFQTLSSLLLQMPFLQLTRKTKGEFDEKIYLLHSLLAGVLSREIGKISNLGDPNTLYICGMIHDIGKVLIFSLFRREWDEVKKLQKQYGLSYYEAEREILGVDHGYIGGILLDLWNIPDVIVNGVKFHHTPESADDDAGSAICVNLGDTLSLYLQDSLARMNRSALKESIRKVIYGAKEFERIRERVNEDFLEEVSSALTEAKAFISGYEHDKGACC